jgi:hypothetical protein
VKTLSPLHFFSTDMKKYFFLIVVAAALVVACESKPNEDNGDNNLPNIEQPDTPAPPIAVNPGSISTAMAPGAYTFAVTSIAAWTVAVNDEAAAWCAVQPAQDAPNDTAIVTIMENATGDLRAATVTFTAGPASLAAAVTQHPTPPYAASTRTWVFGAQTWSDRIHIPECDKGNFAIDFDNPQCRSYTDEDGFTRYYYNWPYVIQNYDALCPSPWRVPSEDDFLALTALGEVTTETLARNWDWYGGYAKGPTTMANVKGLGNYWSTTEYAYRSAIELEYWFNGDLMVTGSSVAFGCLVRCVK